MRGLFPLMWLVFLLYTSSLTSTLFTPPPTHPPLCTSPKPLWALLLWHHHSHHRPAWARPLDQRQGKITLKSERFCLALVQEALLKPTPGWTNGNWWAMGICFKLFVKTADVLRSRNLNPFGNEGLLWKFLRQRNKAAISPIPWCLFLSLFVV